MVKDVFGSPDANDPTSEWDKLVEEAGQDHAAMFKVAKDEILNRQLGSKKVPQAEQDMEWETLRVMAPSLVQFFKDQNASVEDAINHVWAMEQKRGKAP